MTALHTPNREEQALAEVGRTSISRLTAIALVLLFLLPVAGEDRVGLVYYGDGASSTGAWHEGLNFAAVQRCPMVLMVEANRWAFSTPTWKQTRVESFTEKGPGYGIPAVAVDGTDVLAVFEATRDAVERRLKGLFDRRALPEPTHPDVFCTHVQMVPVARDLVVAGREMRDMRYET